MMDPTRPTTGLNGLDEVLDGLRIGDNVVLQVDSIDDYVTFARIFAEASLSSKRRLVYVRFAQHPEILPQREDVLRCTLDASEGFEAFTVALHGLIEREGTCVHYVFDCLSDLQQAWSTDLMTANFFQVTCPYLYELDTIAYFALLRGRHSYDTIARIRETTQLLLDIHRIEDRLFVHPLKVFDRYSPTMFLPHVQRGECFDPITSSSETARLFSALPVRGETGGHRRLDHWDRIFLQAQETQDALEATPEDEAAIQEARSMQERLCRLVIGREERILGLAHRTLTLRDLLAVKSRMIGTGLIGGKAVGMLVARGILRGSTALFEHLEPHDSFYIGSDVFYTYLVQNGWWSRRVAQRKPEGFFTEAAGLRELMASRGTFPKEVREQFQQLLEYFGQSPVIVRSSSLLEDGFGNAFAGKYESVFCSNQGSPAERLAHFEAAVRRVYASTMDTDALAYRKQRGLDSRDEQMALLVQRVSGDRHGRWFYPQAAGVGFSRNAYTWKDDMDPKAGLMRIVYGLGTRAVDRVEGDHPRVVALDHPQLRTYNGELEERQYSQRFVDVVDLDGEGLRTVSIDQLAEQEDWKASDPVVGLFARQSADMARRMRELGRNGASPWLLDFEGFLLRTGFVPLLRSILSTLEAEYENPVDIEFTAHLPEDGGPLQVNVLQCRPLTTKGTGSVHESLPLSGQLIPGCLLLESNGPMMGVPLKIPLSRIVWVDPNGFANLPERDKYEVARIVGRINRLTGDREAEPLLLAGPGRWGTSTASFGVPVTFSEVSNASVLCEVAFRTAGLMPDLSFGSHFFQDLVEADIFYAAVYPEREGTQLDLGVLDRFEDRLVELVPSAARFRGVIRVLDPQGRILFAADPSDRRLMLYET